MNPCPVHDARTATVFLFFIAVRGRTPEAAQIAAGRNAARLCCVTSRDAGRSWGGARDLTEEAVGSAEQGRQAGRGPRCGAACRGRGGGVREEEEPALGRGGVRTGWERGRARARSLPGAGARTVVGISSGAGSAPRGGIQPQVPRRPSLRAATAVPGAPTRKCSAPQRREPPLSSP